MKTYIFLYLLFWSVNASADLTEASCTAKVKAAIEAGLGTTVQEPNVLLYICKGLVDEIKTNGKCVVNVSGQEKIGTLR